MNRILELKNKLKENYLQFNLINKNYRQGKLEVIEEEKNKIVSELVLLTGQDRRELIKEARTPLDVLEQYRIEYEKLMRSEQ